MEERLTEVQALRCADCAASESADRELAPVDRMPIPAEAIAGFPDGVPRLGRHNRRSFLRNGIVGVASVYAATRIPWQAAFEAAVAEGAVANPCLVVIFLNGGNDGLNQFVPTEASQYAAYQKARPTIARALGPSTPAQVGTTPMPGTGGGLGFANVMVSGQGANGPAKGLETLWGNGAGGLGSDLALFPAADYTPPSFSHFTSRDWWFAGTLQKSTTGWLGRWLDLYGSPVNPLQAVSIDSSLSKIIRTQRAPVASISSLNGFGFGVNGVGAAEADVTGEIGGLASAPPGNDATARARGVYGLTVQVAQQLRQVAVGPLPAGYPSSTLSQRLHLAATLILAGLGTRIITIDWGSFDTHGTQLPSQDPQLQTLAQALTAFKDELTNTGLEQRVVTLVFSEFGRRVAQNASAGTDHGAGGPMLVSGSAVRGGLCGMTADVTQPDRGNTQVRTDFRTVYQHLIAEWLGGDPAAILPGGPFPALQRFDGGPATLLR
jgi:uncharacterized protein (DUF1501 family)